MYEGIHIRRPMEKFQGKERMPGDFIPASELTEVSLATLEALKNIGSIEVVTAGPPVRTEGDQSERVNRVEARIDALTDAVTSLVQRLDRIAANPTTIVRPRRKWTRRTKTISQEGTPHGDDT